MAVAFGALAGIMWWRGHQTLLFAAAALGLLFGFAAVTIPDRLGPIYRGWMRFGHLLSRVTTPLVLGLMYLLIFAPIGTVMRLVGRNPIAHRAENNSYWVRRPPARGRAALERQF